MQDLLAGRIDMAILDPPLVQYAIFQHPEWKLKQVPLTPEPDKYPVMSTKYNVIFGINKNEPELGRSDQYGNQQDIWADCLNVKAMAKYGLGDKAWFVPPEKNPRIGVDRPSRLQGANGRSLLLSLSLDRSGLSSRCGQRTCRCRRLVLAGVGHGKGRRVAAPASHD